MTNINTIVANIYIENNIFVQFSSLTGIVLFFKKQVPLRPNKGQPTSKELDNLQKLKPNLDLNS